MNTSTFDSLIRTITTGLTRRSALGALAVGTIAATPGVGPLRLSDTSARKKRKNKKKKRQKDKTPPPPPENVCSEKNWCIDRTQTCAAAGGYGKCLVESTGGNLCAEILFQATTCADCAAPACTNCRCVRAEGGGDRCNNGANGYDFICVREV